MSDDDFLSKILAPKKDWPSSLLGLVDEGSTTITREMLEDAMQKIDASYQQHLRERAHRGARFWGSFPEGFVDWLVTQDHKEGKFVSLYGEVVAEGVPMHPHDARDAFEHLEDLVRRFEAS